jgi:predicted O-linked N-acetylglucosamine transferase (SPINDLY family)
LKLEAAKRGIDPARLIGAARVGSAEHIARLRLADVFLDTWPCNAHTTASDALWAGVPIVTRIGQTFASRVAASLLNAVGLPELICTDTVEYERTAVALAADPDRRAALRERLDAARSCAPLFDTARFTRDIESLYLRMMERHVKGLAPDHLAAAVTS